MGIEMGTMSKLGVGVIFITVGLFGLHEGAGMMGIFGIEPFDQDSKSFTGFAKFFNELVLVGGGAGMVAIGTAAIGLSTRSSTNH